MEVSSMNASWSPDGKYLTYVLRADARVSPAGIVVRPTSGGNARQIQIPLSNIRRLVWLPETQTVLLIGREALTVRHGIYEYGLESGELTKVADPADLPESFLHSTPSRDGKTFYRSDWDPDTGVSTLVAWDLETKKDRTLGSTRGLTWNPTPSPDGRTLAFPRSDPGTGENRLMLIPTTSGSPRAIEVTGGYEPLGSLGNVQWSSVGRFLLVSGGDDEVGTVAL